MYPNAEELSEFICLLAYPCGVTPSSRFKLQWAYWLPDNSVLRTGLFLAELADLVPLTQECLPQEAVIPWLKARHCVSRVSTAFRPDI